MREPQALGLRRVGSRHCYLFETVKRNAAATSRPGLTAAQPVRIRARPALFYH